MKSQHYLLVDNHYQIVYPLKPKSTRAGLYDILPSKVASTQSIADSIIILAEYQYKEAFVANSEINRVAALATLMAEVEWK